MIIFDPCCFSCGGCLSFYNAPPPVEWFIYRGVHRVRAAFWQEESILSIVAHIESLRQKAWGERGRGEEGGRGAVNLEDEHRLQVKQQVGFPSTLFDDRRTGAGDGVGISEKIMENKMIHSQSVPQYSLDNSKYFAFSCYFCCCLDLFQFASWEEHQHGPAVVQRSSETTGGCCCSCRKTDNAMTESSQRKQLHNRATYCTRPAIEAPRAVFVDIYLFI